MAFNDLLMCVQGTRLRYAFTRLHFCTYYTVPRYEAWGTSRLQRYIEVYIIANCVLASQFSKELMLFRSELLVITIACKHYTQVYVTSRADLQL